MEWRIIGLDGLTKTFECKIPGPDLTVAAVCRLLELLAARHLTDEEIVTAVRGRSSLLEARENLGSNRVSLMAGANPHYVADLLLNDAARSA